MKKLILAALVAIFSFQVSSVMAQDELSRKEQRKLEKAEKKQQEKQQQQEKKAEMLEIINDSSFVLEANTIQDDNFNIHQVHSTTNFILIDGKEVIIQTANPLYMGYNGLGGVTIKGSIVDYEVTPGDEDESITVRVELTSAVLGHSMLYINVSSSGASTARLNDNRGNRIVYNGYAYSLENSSIYEGQHLF